MSAAAPAAALWARRAVRGDRFGAKISRRAAPLRTIALKRSSCDGYGCKNLDAWRALNCDDDSSWGCLRKHLLTVNRTFCLSKSSVARASARSCKPGGSLLYRSFHCVSKITIASAKLRTLR